MPVICSSQESNKDGPHRILLLLLQGNMAYAQLSVYKAGKGQQVQSMEIKIQLEGL